jgi:hypothetical protein
MLHSRFQLYECARFYAPEYGRVHQASTKRRLINYWPTSLDDFILSSKRNTTFDIHIHVLLYKMMKIWVKRVDELFSARPVHLTIPSFACPPATTEPRATRQNQKAPQANVNPCTRFRILIFLFTFITDQMTLMNWSDSCRTHCSLRLLATSVSFSLK